MAYLTRCRVRRPALSISGIVMMVIKTMMAPTPMVAYCACDCSIPALLKKSRVIIFAVVIYFLQTNT